MYLDSFCVLEFSTLVLHVLTLGMISSIYNLLRKRSVRIKIRYSFFALKFAP